MISNPLAKPGTYTIVYACANPPDHLVPIGKRLSLFLKPGYYLYVGSAFGVGGLATRVLRHFRKQKKKRWHIDYLSEYVDALGAYYSYRPLNLEHQWAAYFEQLKTSESIPGFGCSDCKCISHLFHMPSTVADTITRFSKIDSIKVGYYGNN